MLKDVWTDKVDGVDVNSAEDINQVANATIALEKATVEITVKTNKNAREIEKIKENQTTVEVDSELSEVSENPLQNKVVTSNLKELKAKNSEISLAVLNNENKTKSLQYYGDANIVPSDSDLFVFSPSPLGDGGAAIESIASALPQGVVIPYEATIDGETLPVTYVWDMCFMSSDIVTIVIPNTVTEIGYRSFGDCTALSTIIIPESMEIIANDAFYGCTALTDVYYRGTKSQWDNITITNGNTDLLNATIHYEWTDVTKGYVDERISEVKPTIFKEEADVDVASIIMEDNHVYHTQMVLNKLTVELPEELEIGYTSVLYFFTPYVIPDDYTSFPENIKFKGDNVEDERFIPETNMRYTIVFDYDGISVIGYVSGVNLI